MRADGTQHRTRVVSAISLIRLMASLFYGLLVSNAETILSINPNMAVNNEAY